MTELSDLRDNPQAILTGTSRMIEGIAKSLAERDRHPGGWQSIRFDRRARRLIVMELIGIEEALAELRISITDPDAPEAQMYREHREIKNEMAHTYALMLRPGRRTPPPPSRGGVAE